MIMFSPFQLTPDDLRHFESIVGLDGMVTDPSQLATYNTDWMKKFRTKKTEKEESWVMNDASAI